MEGKNCVDCKFNTNGKTIFYNKECISTCPPLMEKDVINNSCKVKSSIQNNQNIVSNQNSNISCKTSEIKVNINGTEVCKSCIDANMFIENGKCVVSCSNNNQFNENTKECLECKNLKMKNSNGSISCVDFCSQSEGFFLDFFDKNYCINCKENNLFIEGDTCVKTCKKNYGPDVENKCQPCSILNTSKILEGKCITNCPISYDSMVFNKDTICRFLLKDNECLNNSCFNSGICNIKDYGILKCSCKEDYYGKLCEFDQNYFITSKNKYHKIIVDANLKDILSLEESKEISKIINDIPEVNDSENIKMLVNLYKKSRTNAVVKDAELNILDSLLETKLNM